MKSKLCEVALLFFRLGIIAAVVVQLSLVSVTHWKTAAIAGLSILAVIRFKRINAAWIVLGGSLLGYTLHIL